MYSRAPFSCVRHNDTPSEHKHRVWQKSFRTVSGWYDFVQRSIALALDVNKLQPDIFAQCLWHFTTAKYKSVRTGIDLLSLQTTINIQFSWYALLHKMYPLIQVIYSQHFCNDMILSWMSLIKQFSFSRKKQSTANQQKLDLLMCCYSTMTVSWDSINHAVKCLCRSQLFSVKLSYITHLI